MSACDELTILTNSARDACSDAVFLADEERGRADDGCARLEQLGLAATALALRRVVEALEQASPPLAQAQGDTSVATTAVAAVPSEIGLDDVRQQVATASRALTDAAAAISAATGLVENEAVPQAELTGMREVSSRLTDLVSVLATAHAAATTAARAAETFHAELTAVAEFRPAVPAVPASTVPVRTDPRFPFVEYLKPPKRSYGKGANGKFNKAYEAWVQATHNVPAGLEPAIRVDGKPLFFDAFYTRVNRRGETVGVLVDAKGRYDQFVDKNKPGQFLGWWANSKKAGLAGTLKQARNQVAASHGLAIEWWCAEPLSTKAFNKAFGRGNVLRGRAKAIHKPMPKRET